MVSADSIKDGLRVAFLATDVADAVARADVVETGPHGYSVLTDSREVTHRIARHVIDCFAADPESGDVSVRIEYGLFVYVTIRPALRPTLDTDDRTDLRPKDRERQEATAAIVAAHTPPAT